MRVGEAIALEWGDIDFTNRVIHVRRAMGQYGLSTPKSGKARKVDMSLQLTAELQELKHQRKSETLANGWGSMPEVVFVNTAGTMIDVNNFRKVWNKAQDRLNIARRRIHDIRHTYATLRIMAGHNLADVSGQLGHHSVKFTLDQYFHYLPGHAKGEVDELDQLQPSATQAQPEQRERDLAEAKSLKSLGGLPVDRTLNLRIKSPLLCQLS